MLLHDDPRLRHRVIDGFVRQDIGAIQVKLVVHDHVLAEHGHILHADLTRQIGPQLSRRHRSRLQSVGAASLRNGTGVM